MKIRRTSAGWAALFALVVVARASAQSTAPPIQGTTTTLPGLTMADTITQLTRPVGAPHVGEALGFATKLEVGTAPFGTVSDGLVIKLDSSTGLQVQRATTFGPSLSERALTLGEGNVSVGVGFMSSKYDRLGSMAFDGVRLGAITAATPKDGRSGVANLTLSSNTVVVSGRMGVTERFDLGVIVPVVTVKANGTTSLRNGSGDMILFGQGGDKAPGLGDIAGTAKYRLFAYGTGRPDPGGLAVMGTIRLPTGDPENLRGLGVTRTLLSFIASSGRGRMRPHGNVGFEWWSKSVDVASDYADNGTVSARHQFQYAGGIEFEAAPKLTLAIDLVGRHIMGGGKLGFIPDPSPAPGVSFSEFLVALPEGIDKVDLAPGLKMNLKGKLLLSLNARIALHDGGLHARVTPMAAIDLNF